MNGFGLWLVLLKETNAPIGTCGLIKRETLDDVDIGFAFHPNWFKKGYAQEAAKATLAYGFNKLHLDRIVGITDSGNKASIKLLEKMGFSYETEIELDEDDFVLLFSIIKKPS